MVAVRSAPLFTAAFTDMNSILPSPTPSEGVVDTHSEPSGTTVFQAPRHLRVIFLLFSLGVSNLTTSVSRTRYSSSFWQDPTDMTAANAQIAINILFMISIIYYLPTRILSESRIVIYRTCRDRTDIFLVIPFADHVHITVEIALSSTCEKILCSHLYICHTCFS